MRTRKQTSLARLLQTFFTRYLVDQRRVSPHTVAAYRDTFRMLLRFAQSKWKRPPSSLEINDIDSSLVVSFLTYLEEERGNTARSRNARLAALHSFFRYVALEEPAHIDLAQRVLAIPTKRARRRELQFLTEREVTAILNRIDIRSWGGRRDYALLSLAAQTGLRVSELIGLRVKDVRLDNGPVVHCRGKGRKDRCTPIRKDVAKVLRRWLRECAAAGPSEPLFPNARGAPLSRDGVSYILAKYVRDARHACPSLRRKRVTPHVLRHSAAMELLNSGVDRSVIALWLGHETAQSTDIYLHADLALKERALSKTAARATRRGRYRPSDTLIAFLEDL